jgi:hypothetical protein
LAEERWKVTGDVFGVLAATGSPLDQIREAINWLCQPHLVLILSCAALALFLRWYRVLTPPRVAIPLAVAGLAFFLASAFDPNFRKIITKEDNVPIVLMLFFLAYLVWLGFRQAAINDAGMEKGVPLREAGADDKVLVWPDLVYTELICLVILTAVLVVWAILLPAPLEQPADPNIAPNPAKAPWYFLGLQEMLVYFDPWLAGVVLPGLIIVGLAAIPYMDINPRGNGYYTFRERPFAIGMFLVGFLILWVVLIVFGTFLRGPNWNFYGPYEYWDLHRPAALLNVEFHDLFWVGILGRPVPKADVLFIPGYIIRELPGIVLVGGFFLFGPWVLRALFFRRLYRRMGFLRYSVMATLLLVMMLIPIKMVLRWTLNLHYIVGITEWFLNI